MKPPYEYINHTADLGVEVNGASLEELFINVGKAIFETQVSGEVLLEKNIKIEIQSESIEELFVDWCRELIYNFSIHHFIPKTYGISLDNFSLKANLSGEAFNPQRHKIKIEIKNPTYHNLHIKKTKGNFQAIIIFDV